MASSDEEMTYFRSQRLARLATVGRDGQPDVAPLGFDWADTQARAGARVGWLCAGFDQQRIGKTIGDEVMSGGPSELVKPPRAPPDARIRHRDPTRGRTAPRTTH
jgi:pyridoxamine 5'-phosphate oxidase family protein